MVSIQTEQSQDGDLIPILCGTKGIQHLGSIYDNLYFSRCWLDYHIQPQTENIILLGGGSGRLIEEALQRIAGEILVVEPENILYNKMRKTACYKRANRTNRVTWACGDTIWREAEKWIRRILNEDSVETTFLSCHSGYSEYYTETWERLQAICDTVCQEIAFMKAPIKRFIRAMTENEIRNVPKMHQGILIGRCKRSWDKKMPVIMVSAGPSLDKNVHELHRVRGRALIFCVDAAVSTLLKAGIVPDLIACTDAMKRMACFEDKRCETIPILVTTNTPAALLDLHKGIRIWGHDHPFVNLMLQKQKLPCAEIPFYSGVATALFASVIELGAETIILAGQDLAYSEDGRSHVSGRNEGCVKDENYQLEGYYGGRVYSRGDWVSFHGWFEKMLQVFPQRKVINATEGGAKIRGTLQMPLRQVIDELPEHGGMQDFLNHAEFYLTEEEYKGLCGQYEKCRKFLNELDGKSYHQAFYERNWRENPVMYLIVDYMKSLDDEKREERYKKAVSYVKQTWDCIENEQEGI